MITLNKSVAFLLIDYQNDFGDYGSIKTSGSREKIKDINLLLKRFYDKKLLTIASLDTHPDNHKSFKKNGGIWPVHCVRNSIGWKIINGVNLSLITKYIYKGENTNAECYSAFEDEFGNETELHKYLIKNKIKILYIGGIALEYCVIETIKSALKFNYKVILDMKITIYINKNDAISLLKKYKDKIIILNNG